MKCSAERRFPESSHVKDPGSSWYKSMRIFWAFTVWDVARGLMSCVYIINREGHLVRCGGGTEAGYWLGLGRKSVWTEEEREKKIRKSKWNHLQNSLRKWNSKKLKAIVQRCGFLRKYDSPCAEREKIAGLEKTRVRSCWEMMCQWRLF